jgi:hypothetical protein
MEKNSTKQIIKPKKKTIGGCALGLKVIQYKNPTNEKEEIPTLLIDLCVTFKDEDGYALCYSFIMLSGKQITNEIRSYPLVRVMTETHEELFELTLFRKDISSTETSNIVICKDCDESHFEWTDLKLEVGNTPETTRFVDSLELPLDYISYNDLISVDATVRKVPEVDLYD